MPIDPGTAVSHYRIIGPLGSGGMGEVYKAYDTTLERTIALKILPHEVVKNDERLRRFVQEARSASSLNHPHIVTIHEIGEADVPLPDDDGEDRTDRIHYIAMELVEGSTLKRKIHSEGTDLRTLIGYLAQAAEGLAKAHGAGIVHRDLKPENVMISTDGFAKVLDFGLAKLTARKPLGGESNDPTAVRDQTREGAILGTIAYMSPEQVQGKAVDHRSDIFSFGAILYEAATRQRPFDADSDVDVMHKILHDKPQPVDEVNPEVPAELRRLIRRCLAKDPDKRFHSMKDLAIELREIADEYEELSISGSSKNSGSISSEAVEPRASRRLLLAVSIAALLVTLAAVGFAVYQWRESQQPRSGSFASMKFKRITTSGAVDSAIISPDGKYVAHVSRGGESGYGLFVRQIATGSDVPVIAASRARITNLQFTPDGSYLYYSYPDDAAGYLSTYQVPAFGGTPRKIAFDVDTAVTFSPDGKQMAFGRGAPHLGETYLLIANADGSGEKKIATFRRFGSPDTPVWSPDGRTIVAPVRLPPSGQAIIPVEIDVATGRQREVGAKKWWWIASMAFLPDSSGLLMAALPTEAGAVQVWLQPLPDGEPVRVTNDLNAYVQLSAAQDGQTIGLVQSDFIGRLAVVDPTGTVEEVIVPALKDQDVGQVSASRTGAIAVDVYSPGVSNVGIMDSIDAPLRLLTSDDMSFDSSISPDGSTVLFASGTEADSAHIFSIGADGSSRTQLTKGESEFEPVLAPDGRTIVYESVDGIWRMSRSGGAPVRIAERTVGGFAISPDSKLIAYFHWSTENGMPGLIFRVDPLEGGEPLLRVPASSDRAVAWTFDGDLTLVVTSDGVPNLFRQPLSGGDPVQLTKFTSGGIQSFAWLPDGRLLVVRTEDRADFILVTDFR